MPSAEKCPGACGMMTLPIESSLATAAAAVPRGAGPRAGCPRPALHPAPLCEPGDAPSAGANFDNIQDRDADREPFVIAADKIIRRKTRLAAANDAGLGGRATHVECDRSFEVKHLPKRHRPDDSAGGSPVHKMDKPAPRPFDTPPPA